MTSLRERLRAALPVAMKARDATAVAALRSALSAIDNAEAVAAAPTVTSDAPIAGSVVGVGAGDVPRRTLTEDDTVRIVAAEVAERRDAADGYERAGQLDEAERLRAEAAVLTLQLRGDRA